jgi:hypothetical protein
VRSNPVRVGMYMKDGSFKKPFAWVLQHLVNYWGIQDYGGNIPNHHRITKIPYYTNILHSKAHQNLPKLGFFVWE